jgi:hypothetical protein
MKKIILLLLLCILLLKIGNAKTTLSGFTRFELRSIYLTKNPVPEDISALWTGIDTISREPNLMIQIHSEPSYNSTFNIQIGFNTKLDGNFNTTMLIPSGPFIANGKWITKLGDYQFSIGGPYWELKNSPLIFGSGISGGRRVYFERYPWDNVIETENEYKNIVENFDWIDTADKSSDRLGSRGLKGLKFEGFKMPAKLELLFFYGVNDQYYNTYSRLMFGNIKRKISDLKMGLNFGQHILDSNEINTLYSITINFKIFDINGFSEIGFSRTENSLLNEKKNGGAFYINMNKFIIPKIPLKFAFYYAHPTYKGIDTSVIPTKRVLSTDSYILPNIISEENSLYNNRTGLILKSGYILQNILFNISLGIARTIEKTENKIIFPHHLNHHSWFYLYNGRETKYYGSIKAGYDVDYEGAYEIITLPNTNTNYKYFNLLSLGLNFHIFERTFIFTKLQINDINNELMESNILHAVYYDLFLAQGIIQKFFIILFCANETFKSEPQIHQKDQTYGFGFNFDVYNNSGIYFRTRKFIHNDLKGGKNDFNGWWSSLEFKAYF